jgi:UDP-glucose 4-epimerase
MSAVDVKTLVFSSSATVYGAPQYLPIDESHPTNPTNPYGRTKLYIEEILRDLSKSDPEWRIICLRYFNPVGAHESGLIGESPNGIPNNLMPYIVQVGCRIMPYLNIYGGDYPTHDGTGVRDYIHVMDLGEGHSTALQFLGSFVGIEYFNLGTGRGTSVLDLITAYRAVSGQDVPYQITSRRIGDIAVCYASCDKSKEISWSAKRGINEMCSSAWK